MLNLERYKMGKFLSLPKESSLLPTMTPTPLDKPAQSTPFDKLVQSAPFDTLVQPPPDATAGPSPVVLGAPSVERSGVGILAVAVFAAAVSVLAVIPGIAFWRYRRHWFKLTQLAFLRKEVAELFWPPEVSPSRRNGTPSSPHQDASGNQGGPVGQGGPNGQGGPDGQHGFGEQGGSGGQGGPSGQDATRPDPGTETGPNMIDRWRRSLLVYLDLHAHDSRRCIGELMTAIADHNQRSLPIFSPTARASAAKAEGTWDALWTKFSVSAPVHWMVAPGLTWVPE